MDHPLAGTGATALNVKLNLGTTGEARVSVEKLVDLGEDGVGVDLAGVHRVVDQDPVGVPARPRPRRAGGRGVAADRGLRGRA